LYGKVLSVSQSAIACDKPQDKSESSPQSGAESETSEPKARSWPGMAVTVEIKTGSRRVISYLLSPVLRYRQESLRER